MQFFITGRDAIAEQAVSLTSDWRLLGTTPGACESPATLPDKSTDWLAASVPGTVAQTLQQHARWDINQVQDFDARDWWYVCDFSKDRFASADRYHLRFAGLATLADVWLNGQCILQSENMFIEHVLDVTRLLREHNQLHVCFRALLPVLGQRRGRPQWKTRLVAQQNLRWIRTSLLGRIPGWSPPVAPVGPWRDVLLEPVSVFSPRDVSVHAELRDGKAVVRVACTLDAPEQAAAPGALLQLDDQQAELTVTREQQTWRIQGELQLDQPELWWPHTHGKPRLYPCQLSIHLGSETITLACGDIGFRQIEADRSDGGFRLRVNGSDVFCRGACWTVNDIVSLRGSDQSLAQSLQLARDAGMNMIRVGGTMIYESEVFYRLCDQLGILVWQDFMFANMDYPVDDTAFTESVTRELTQQLQRWAVHPCIAVYCGNSEVEQQAAMLGMPQAAWRSHLFGEVIPTLCERWHPGIPYVPSTPSGGTLPFHVGHGITHYYGVGAYLRPVSEVRRNKVRFTPECLGFSNVPEDTTLNALFAGQLPVTHHPLWKSRVPRDSGTGWDFEDVRDHYLQELFGHDPVKLRSFDMTGYLALSRITTGEIMSQVYAEWRSAYSQCGGALVWFYKDLWQGAGWGIIDSDNQPKACYRYLQRSWQAQTVLLTDEGLDGVHVHVINEKPEPLVCRVELQLLRNGNVVTARAEQDVNVVGRSVVKIESDALLNGFYDVAYAYRFGPPKHDVVVASLLDNEGNSFAEAFYFPGKRTTEQQAAAKLQATARKLDNGDYHLSLESDCFLQAVHFDVKGYAASDEYFHLVPGRRKQLHLRKTGEEVKRFRGYVESISLEEAVGITLDKQEIDN